MTSAAAGRLTIAVIHPELGFGGAERLVLDAAMELTRRGHRVTTFTARCDTLHSFEETRDVSLDIRVRGSWLPHDVLQRARVPCSTLRMTALAAAARREIGRVDVVFCDLIPHAIPAMAAILRAPVVFYCHFPDFLLAPPGGSGAYRFYRRGVDALERYGMCHATRVATNSRYTLARLREMMPAARGIPCDVVYPGIDLERFARIPALLQERPRGEQSGEEDQGEIVMLALGRFHPDKNPGLAVETLAALRGMLPPATFARLRLAIVGGLDRALDEQRHTFEATQALVRAHGLVDRVTLLPSPTDEEGAAWMARAAFVLHTAPAEHFGIVPIEAMGAGRPVVAVDFGGPPETVLDGVTGFLCEPTAAAFAAAAARLIDNPRLAAEMGAAGRRHVAEHFSRAAFGSGLEQAIRKAVAPLAR